jgi:two-component system cell cycle sensor histidine kinase/response regulator CckA
MSTPLNVLLIEDSEDDTALIVRTIQRGGYETHHLRVETPDAFNTALATTQWDAIICDHSVPGLTSFTALEALRARDLDVPVIIVSGTIGEETAVRAMKAGAHDYVMKHNLARLLPALDRELREAQERAERRRAEAAVKLYEMQLRQAQKMEAIGRLAGGIAHDFNNLLTAIIGYSDLLMQALPADDPTRRDVEAIKLAGDRGAALTRQLLAFSRQQVVEKRVVDLRDVVRDFEKLLRRLIGSDIELRVSYCEELATVMADPGQIGQIVMNLAVNARDAMPDGGLLTLGIACEPHREPQQPEAARWIVLSVKDTGIGMNAETQAHVFEPFFTTKRAGHGTGLGLSTVYGIAQQSGGDISIESAVGKGTLFRIWLPFAEEERSESEKEMPARDMAPLACRTILVAEDDALIRQLLRQALSDHSLIEAADGFEALERLEGLDMGELDLLITEMMMPGLRGQELARQARTLQPHAQILFLSGYDEGAREGLVDEEAEFLQKPFTVATIRSMVQKLLTA